MFAEPTSRLTANASAESSADWSSCWASATSDDETDARLLADKIGTLRIFDDPAGKMNLALADVAGSVLVVSQFTLLGDCRKGRRPSFTAAAPPERAEPLYEFFVAQLRRQGHQVQTGRFRAEMQLELTNDGPVTLIIESQSLRSLMRIPPARRHRLTRVRLIAGPPHWRSAGCGKTDLAAGQGRGDRAAGEDIR